MDKILLSEPVPHISPEQLQQRLLTLAQDSEESIWTKLHDIIAIETALQAHLQTSENETGTRIRWHLGRMIDGWILDGSEGMHPQGLFPWMGVVDWLNTFEQRQLISGDVHVKDCCFVAPLNMPDNASVYTGYAGGNAHFLFQDRNGCKLYIVVDGEGNIFLPQNIAIETFDILYVPIEPQKYILERSKGADPTGVVMDIEQHAIDAAPDADTIWAYLLKEIRAARAQFEDIAGGNREQIIVEALFHILERMVPKESVAVPMQRNADLERRLRDVYEGMQAEVSQVFPMSRTLPRGLKQTIILRGHSLEENPHEGTKVYSYIIVDDIGFVGLVFEKTIHADASESIVYIGGTPPAFHRYTAYVSRARATR